jgi:hypothetical protein
MRTLLIAGLFLLPQVLPAQKLEMQGGNLVLSYLPADEPEGAPLKVVAKGGLLQGTATPEAERLKKFMTAVVAANASGEAEKVLALWMEDERPNIRKMMDDPKVAGANKALYRNMKTSEPLAYIEYGTYVLLFVRHEGQSMGAFVNTYPIKEVKGTLYLTNRLRDDAAFSSWSRLFERELGKLTPKGK